MNRTRIIYPFARQANKVLHLHRVAEPVSRDVVYVEQNNSLLNSRRFEFLDGLADEWRPESRIGRVQKNVAEPWALDLRRRTPPCSD